MVALVTNSTFQECSLTTRYSEISVTTADELLFGCMPLKGLIAGQIIMETDTRL